MGSIIYDGDPEPGSKKGRGHYLALALMMGATIWFGGQVLGGNHGSVPDYTNAQIQPVDPDMVGVELPRLGTDINPIPTFPPFNDLSEVRTNPLANDTSEGDSILGSILFIKADGVTMPLSEAMRLAHDAPGQYVNIKNQNGEKITIDFSPNDYSSVPDDAEPLARITSSDGESTKILAQAVQWENNGNVSFEAAPEVDLEEFIDAVLALFPEIRGITWFADDPLDLEELNDLLQEETDINEALNRTTHGRIATQRGFSLEDVFYGREMEIGKVDRVNVTWGK